MSMKLYLLRHANAEPGYPDATRLLTSRGRHQARELGRFFRDKPRFAPALLWCSPLVRAQETVTCFVEGWGATIAEQSVEERLEPEMDPGPLLEKLQSIRQDVLIVGHNPNLQILASLLLSHERHRTRVRFKTCSLMCLEWHPLPNYGQFGPCELCWMLDPRW